MSVLEKLSQEHSDVLQKMALLGVTLEGLEAGKAELLKKNILDINVISEFFEKDVSFHFETEEKTLFPMLERVGVVDKTFISDLIAEHRIIMEMISEFQSIVKSGIENESRKRELIKLGEWIVEKLSAHAREENEKLLPLARQVLKPEQLEEIGRIVKEMKSS